MANPFQSIGDSNPSTLVPVNPGTLIQANNTVNGSVQKVLDDFTAAKQQNTVDSFLNTGYKQLISAMGVNPEDLPVLRESNPPIVDAGVAAASSVFMQIVNEKLTQANIGPVKSLNYIFNLVKYPIPTIYESLPSDLIKMHWFIIFAETLLRKKRLPDIDFRNQIPTVFENTRSYAQDLVTTYAPKQKFLFLMDVTFKGPFAIAGIFDPTFTFQLKRADRPKYKIEHEDINMYNFHTVVPKRVSWDPITIDLYDMNDNSSLNFFLQYMKIISPIMRTTAQDTSLILPTIDSAGLNYDAGSYDGTITQLVEPTIPWTASLGPITYNNTANSVTQGQSENSVIESITIYHVYQFGKYVDRYRYFNPRVTDFVLDELTMSESGVNSISFTFVYDQVDIKVGVPTSTILGNLQRTVADGVKHMNFDGVQRLTPTTTPNAQQSSRTIGEQQQEQIQTSQDTLSPRQKAIGDDITKSFADKLQPDGSYNPPVTPSEYQWAQYEAVSNHPRGPDDPPLNADAEARKWSQLQFGRNGALSGGEDPFTTVPSIGSIPDSSPSSFAGSISNKINGRG